jgi:hypothetical protein
VAGSFSLDLSRFVEKAKGNADKVVRLTVLHLGKGIVEKSPVGNPELWAVNRVAAAYNREVSDYNGSLRNDPANLTKAGHLKKGLKLVDGMPIKAPAGYVGGRFRANWQYGYGKPTLTTLPGVDPSGQATLARIQAGVMSNPAAGVHYVVNNLPYTRPLEYEGHSSQAPAGMVRVTVAEFRSYIEQAIRSL